MDDLIKGMHTCEQTAGQTVFQHGTSVCEHTFDLIARLKGEAGNPSFEWRLPDCIVRDGSKILESLHSEEIISTYTRLHDIGKPLCRTVDEQGRAHFPDHANVSRACFLAAGGDPIAANLIGWDMVLHQEKAEEIALRLQGGYFAAADKSWERGYQPWTKQDACTLLIVALSELHSNARLFGGIESTSFKIKWKQLSKRGNQICKFYFEGGTK